MWRGLTCHVTRARPLLILWSSIPCLQLAGARRHAAKPFDVPSLTKVPAMGASTDHWRNVTKNHSLSRRSGPPCDTLKS